MAPSDALESSLALFCNKTGAYYNGPLVRNHFQEYRSIFTDSGVMK
jgi:hypothetical protein